MVIFNSYVKLPEGRKWLRTIKPFIDGITQESGTKMTKWNDPKSDPTQVPIKNW